jgi:O-antigen/teichoic acid export membrane protein
MGAQYFAFAVQFITSVIISRFFLGPDEVGLFSIALAAAMLISIFQDFGLTRYIAGAKDLDDAHIRTCSSVSFLFSFLVAAGIAALAWPLSQFYGEPRLFAMLLIIASSYLLIPWSVVPIALLTCDMNFKGLFVVNAGAAVATGGVSLGLAAAGWSAESLAWAAIAQAAARSLMSQWMRPSAIPIPLALKDAMPVIRFGSQASGLYVIGGIGVRSPDLIVGRMLGMFAVGLFSRATSLAAQLRQLVSGAIGGVFYPAFARIRDRGDSLGAPYARVVSGLTAVTWPAMAALAAASEPIVLMLYGERWSGVAPLLAWIALSEMFFVALPLHTDLPILMGRIRTLIGINLLDTIAAIGLLALAALVSVELAAQSRIAYGIIWVGLYARFLHQIVGFEWKALLGVYLKSAVATLATVAPFLIAYAMWRSTAELGFAGLLVCSAAGCIAWLATIYLIAHPVRDEITDIARPFLKGLRLAG